MNRLVCITGVSGSGKSTLVHEVLYRAVSQALGQAGGRRRVRASTASLENADRLNDIVLVDQNPIGRTPRSNPVTYIKAFDANSRAVRFAARSGAARLRSPATSPSTCPAGGAMSAAATARSPSRCSSWPMWSCPVKNVTVLVTNPSVLEIRYKNKNIHELLGMTVKEALRFLAGQPKIVDKLAVLDEVGLGYVRLGQSATTLSGGEAQRVKLAAHLATARTSGRGASTGGSRVLYVLDEPTTGLHFDDVSKLLLAFRKLIDGGGSLVVIEHNLDVIKSADWVIDMGPEGGSGGGQVVAVGTPEQITAKRALAHRAVAGPKVLGAPKLETERAAGRSGDFVRARQAVWAVPCSRPSAAAAQSAPPPAGDGHVDEPAAEGDALPSGRAGAEAGRRSRRCREQNRGPRLLWRARTAPGRLPGDAP